MWDSLCIQVKSNHYLLLSGPHSMGGLHYEVIYMLRMFFSGCFEVANVQFVSDFHTSSCFVLAAHVQNNDHFIVLVQIQVYVNISIYRERLSVYELIWHMSHP